MSWRLRLKARTWGMAWSVLDPVAYWLEQLAEIARDCADNAAFRELRTAERAALWEHVERQQKERTDG